LELPLLSVATDVTRFVPGAKNAPLAGVLTTVGLGSQVSVAVTLKVTLVPLSVGPMTSEMVSCT